MSDARQDAVVRPGTIRLGVQAPSPRIALRNYFSTHLLWGSQDFGLKAASIEHEHTGDSRDIEHRAYVLGSVISAASFLEAMINELFQDAYDGHGITGEGTSRPL